MTLRLPALAALLVAAALPASAEDLSFGVRAGLAAPGGDLGETVGSRAGLAAGLHLRRDLDNGHAILPRLDYARFSGDQEVPGGTRHATQQLVSLGADYAYALSGQVGEGFTVSVGLGALWKQTRSSAGPAVPQPVDGERDRTRPYGAVGLGYAFSRSLDLDLRLQAFQDSRAGDTFNASTGGYDTVTRTSTVTTVSLAWHF